MNISFVMELVSTEPDGSGHVGIMFRFLTPTDQFVIPMEGVPMFLDEIRRLIQAAEEQRAHNSRTRES